MDEWRDDGWVNRLMKVQINGKVCDEDNMAKC